MLSILVKKQFTEIFRAYYYDQKKNRARSKVATTLFFLMFAVLMVAILGLIFSGIAVMLCSTLTGLQLDWFYFLIMGILATFLGAFGSIFNTFAGLYLAKDNDLLLSMPIPVRVIVASRLLTVYLMGLMYSAVISLPTVIVYLVLARCSIGTLIGGVMFIFSNSLIVMILSCFLGWIVAKISQKLKRKGIVTVLISLAFFGAYYFFCFQAPTMMEQLLNEATQIGDRILHAAYPLYLLGRVGTGDPIAILVAVVALAAILALVCCLITRGFLKIATASGSSGVKTRYRAERSTQRSTFLALLGRELAHFLSSPTYMLNCALGIAVLPLGGVVLLLRGGGLSEVLSEIFPGASAAPYVLLAMLCFAISMINITAPSVSLEGKTIWLAHVLPVTPWQVLRAKLALHSLLAAVPTLFCIVCAAIAMPIAPTELIFVLLQAFAYILLCALLGLFFGLKMPNLNWTSEIVPIKQGFAVLLSVLSSLFFGMLTMLGILAWMMFSIGFYVFMTALLALTVAMDALLILWLKKRGCKIFSSL